MEHHLIFKLSLAFCIVGEINIFLLCVFFAIEVIPESQNWEVYGFRSSLAVFLETKGWI